MVKVNFIHYFDVWGNAENGYEVNDQCVLFRDVELPDLKDKTLIGFLKEKNFFNVRADRRSIRIDEYGAGMLEVVGKKGDYPYGAFQIIEE